MAISGAKHAYNGDKSAPACGAEMEGAVMSFVFGVMLVCGVLALLAGQGGDAATASMLAGAGEAVTLCLELAGAYLLFMGMMGVARRAGLMDALSRALSPAIRLLFPRADGAAGPIALCFAANILGMGNAATPFGLEAMRALDANNPRPGVATDEMCVLIAVNASALQLLPTGLLALRQAAGSAEPAAVVLPSLIASAVSTAVAVVLCLLCTGRLTMRRAGCRRPRAGARAV